MLPILLQGFMVSGSLIIAIGAQNAYVLKQGILKQHIFWVVLICFLCDILLISLGIFGLGGLLVKWKFAQLGLALLGAVFLIVYGYRSAKSAYVGNNSLVLTDERQQSIWQTVLMTLAITLLNPHVYLDTVVIIGGIAGSLSFEEKRIFLIGALLASFIWFFSLGYGARLLTPLFKKPITWRILDAFVAVIMWLIAFSLLRYIIHNFGNTINIV